MRRMHSDDRLKAEKVSDNETMVFIPISKFTENNESYYINIQTVKQNGWDGDSFRNMALVLNDDTELSFNTYYLVDGVINNLGFVPQDGEVYEVWIGGVFVEAEGAQPVRAGQAYEGFTTTLLEDIKGIKFYGADDFDLYIIKD